MTEFSDADKSTIRSGVMGAVVLVSQADPGFFDTFKESRAAAGVMAQAPEAVKQILTGMPSMPPMASSKEEMKASMMSRLSEAMQVASKDPATLDALRSYVTAATQQVAEASKGVSPEEQQVLDEIHQVLGQAGQGPQTQPAEQLQAGEPQAAPAAGVDQQPNQVPGV